MLGLLFLSFFGGALTILSPCVLPLLPVIVGGSISERQKWRPVVITASLAGSVTVFTLLLKWSTSLIDVPQEFWAIISGALIIGLGVITVFPNIWEHISTALKLSDRANTTMVAQAKKESWTGPLLTGIALGPVFSSCSPTYALILATILPQSFIIGTVYMIAYTLGLSAVLLLIAVFGQAFVQKMKWAANPNGVFRRVIGLLFIVIGLFVALGIDKDIETSLVAKGLGVTAIEQRFVDQAHVSMDKAMDFDGKNLQNNDSVVLNVKKPYTAPDVEVTQWMNTDPISLADLRGKVVIVDFWTYSCINCIRTLPVLNKWHTEYADDGLVIIGVHAPEFSFEQKADNVQKAIAQYGIEYPVGLDNNYDTWNAYSNRYWPAKYFIDKSGKVRHTHFGEGGYQESEEVIRELLAEDEGPRIETDLTVNAADDIVPAVAGQTPETYCGYERQERFANRYELSKDAVVEFSRKEIDVNEWTLEGAWKVEGERVVAAGENAKLRLQFAAKSVYVVAQSDTPTTAKIYLNGEPIASSEAGSDVDENGLIHITNDRLYHVVELPQFRTGDVLEIIPEQGAAFNAFTFGSK